MQHFVANVTALLAQMVQYYFQAQRGSEPAFKGEALCSLSADHYAI
jgi:hypothetical protein